MQELAPRSRAAAAAAHLPARSAVVGVQPSRLKVVARTASMRWRAPPPVTPDFATVNPGYAWRW